MCSSASLIFCAAISPARRGLPLRSRYGTLRGSRGLEEKSSALRRLTAPARRRRRGGARRRRGRGAAAVRAGAAAERVAAAGCEAALGGGLVVPLLRRQPSARCPSTRPAGVVQVNGCPRRWAVASLRGAGRRLPGGSPQSPPPRSKARRSFSELGNERRPARPRVFKGRPVFRGNAQLVGRRLKSAACLAPKEASRGLFAEARCSASFGICRKKRLSPVRLAQKSKAEGVRGG